MKYIIREEAEYEVEADTAQAALDQFLDGGVVTKFPTDVTAREVLNTRGEWQEVNDP